MVPLEIPKVLEIPNVVVVVVALFAPDEGVVQALRDSFAASRATRDIQQCQKGTFEDQTSAHAERRSLNMTLQTQRLTTRAETCCCRIVYHAQFSTASWAGLDGSWFHIRS